MKRRQLVDVGLPIGLAIVATAEALLVEQLDGPRGAAVALALGTTLPLMARRRRPLTVLVAVLLAVAVCDEAWRIMDDVQAPFIGALIAVYSSAAYSDKRHAWYGAGIIAAFAFGMAADDPLGDVFFIGGIMLAVWGAANVVRSRHELATQLAARTVELEHEREETAKLAVAEERARIARELHDVVAHNLSIMIVQAGAERRAIAEDNPDTAEVLETIEETGRAAMAEMRRLLGMLRRSDDELALAPQPTLARISELVEQVRSAGMPVELAIEGEPRELPAGVDLSAYRIVQEALTNALKHAGPASARVTVRYGRDDLDIEIVDDGTAASTREANGGGHGLIGMRERALLFGGDLDAGRAAGGGYTVRARLPLRGAG